MPQYPARCCRHSGAPVISPLPPSCRPTEAACGRTRSYAKLSSVANPVSDPEGRRAQLGQLSLALGAGWGWAALPAGLQEGLVQPTRLLCRTESSPALWVTVKNVAGGAPHQAGSEHVVKNQHTLDCRELSPFAGGGKARARLP